ncbi:MAG: hypothetical protein ACR2HA_12030, partial [Nocardioides sp.]
GLVPEVDAALEELTHGDDGHGCRSFFRSWPPARSNGQTAVRVVAGLSVVAAERVLGCPDAQRVRTPRAWTRGTEGPRPTVTRGRP